MSLVRARDTQPEMLVRRALSRAGVRYRLHARNVPGSPDISIKKWRVAIFVHGCFWHRHNCKAGQRVPKSNVSFWQDKFAANERRDHIVSEQLTAAGWTVFTFWECEIRNATTLVHLVDNFLAAINRPKPDGGSSATRQPI